MHFSVCPLYTKFLGAVFIDVDNWSVWFVPVPLAGAPPTGQRGKSSLLVLLSRNAKKECSADLPFFCSSLLIHFARSSDQVSIISILYLEVLLSATDFFYFFNVYLLLRDTEREQGRGRERGRHRIWSRLQVLSSQHRAWCGARTHKLRDHDLSWSRSLNQLSHPGAPGKK